MSARQLLGSCLWVTSSIRSVNSVYATELDIVRALIQPLSPADLYTVTAALLRSATEGPGARIPLPSLTLQVLTLHDI